jgi:hypothetical protein
VPHSRRGRIWHGTPSQRRRSTGNL